ncbi:MAG: hypothetical protein ACQEW0_16515 [Pseudomonadota bacterium]
MAEIYANNIRGKLADPILAADTSITLEPGHNFPDPGSNWYRATLYRWEFNPEGVREFDHEVVKVTARAGDVLTVERALEGTALDYDPDTPIELRMTAGTASDIEGRASQALDDHEAKTDPHEQYEFRVLHNTNATRAPTANDDSPAGYSPRSTWFDASQTPPEAYRCIDATEGAAVWVKTTLTLDELGTAALENAADLRARSTHTGTQPLSTISDAGSAAARDAVGSGDVYARGGILGTVSESGGVPTGAIIERGSNANGEYVKFAGGRAVAIIPYAELDGDSASGGRFLGTPSLPLSLTSADYNSFTIIPVTGNSINSPISSATVDIQDITSSNTVLGNSNIPIRIYTSSTPDASDRLAITAIVHGRWD